MVIEKFTKTNFKDFVTSKLQQNLEKFFLQLYLVPFLKGTYLKDIQITTTSQSFKHGLSSVPQGFIVLDKQANAVIWRNTASEGFISLQSDNDVTASVWVF